MGGPRGGAVMVMGGGVSCVCVASCVRVCSIRCNIHHERPDPTTKRIFSVPPLKWRGFLGHLHFLMFNAAQKF